MFFGRLNLEKEIEELEKELLKERQEKLRIIAEANETMVQDRKRIDVLLKDIEQRFNAYMENLKGNVAVIRKQDPLIECKVYRDDAQIEPIEYGEIRIEPLHLKFIKGRDFNPPTRR